MDTTPVNLNLPQTPPIDAFPSVVAQREIQRIYNAIRTLQSHLGVALDSAGVTSFANRSGAVLPQKGDYSFGDIAGLNTAATKKVEDFDAAGSATTAANAVLATSVQKAANLSDLADIPTARTNLGLGTAALSDATAFDVAGAAAAVLATSLQLANNLADLANAAIARTNLGLGTAATHDAADFAGAGTADMLKADNLAGLTNYGTARTNLGLGSAALAATTDFDAAGDAAAVLASSLQKANNLSDLASAATARTNLGLGSAATSASTDFDAAGSAAAVLATSLQIANNFSDIANAVTARANLGLGSAALRDESYFALAGSGGGDMYKADNLSGLASYPTARTNLGLGTLATQSGTFSGTSSGTNTGDVSLSAFGSTPTANGASITGQALVLEPADASHPGGVSTAAQTFAGAKTFADGIVLADGKNIDAGTSTGMQIGTSVSQKIAFHGATPVVQRSGSAQAALSIGASTTLSWGYPSKAQADSIPVLVNEIRATLVEAGLMKGSA